MSESNQANDLQKNLVASMIADRKSERRWRNFRFFVWIFILLLYAVLIFGPTTKELGQREVKTPYVSLVQLNGAIMPGTSFSARRVLPILNHAFADKASKGVILLINSPGGSPVQASIIHDKILELKQKYHKKVVVVGEDALASGAYLVATAADKIYVNPDTLTGSIGVIMSSFGFTDAIEKLGITRRVYTAGTNKDRLDPFLPVTDADKAKIQGVLDQVHQSFIQDVLQGRKGKLHGDEKELFSGDFWTGEQAVKLGLADGTANLWTVMKTEFDVTHYKNYTARPSLFQALFKDVQSHLSLGLMSNYPRLEAVI